jgi:hypothetical protein
MKVQQAALTAFFKDIDPCDGTLQSENAICSGFSRAVVAHSANASFLRSMWIMSYHFHERVKRRYGTSKHCA